MHGVNPRRFVVAGAFFLVLSTAGCQYPFLNSASVCGRCGIIRRTERVFWIDSHSYEETEVSRWADDGGKHNWLICHWSGGGIRACGGAGTRLLYPVRLPEVGKFLALVAGHYDSATAKQWAQIALDPRQHGDALSLMCNDMRRGYLQADDPPNAESFRQWYTKAVRRWNKDPTHTTVPYAD